MATLSENIERNNQFHTDLRDLITVNGGDIPADTPCEDLLPIIEDMFGGGSSADTQYLKSMIERPQDAEIVVPEGTTKIGDSSFYQFYMLKKILMPNSITSIGSRAFYYCTSLQSITLPNSITSIGSRAFDSCTSLQSITLPNSITSIGSRAFGYCTSLQSITLPNSITSIGDSAFYFCASLQSITLPNSITSIGDSAFYSCVNISVVDLTAYTDPSSIPALYNINAFRKVSSDCVFLVANAEMQAAFSSATNWSTLTFTIQGA